MSCRWCDTPYTWDWTGMGDSGVAYDPRQELQPMAWTDVLRTLLDFQVPLIVVSGGEPLSQQRRLIPLIRELRSAGRKVEIETNGTVVPRDELVELGVRFNVSPKLSHSGDPESRRIVPAALRALAAVPDTAFKFVCRNQTDLDEVTSLVDRYGTRPVWIMPEGQVPTEVGRHLSALGDDVVARGWNLTTRLHVAIWGDKRGV
ncbi:radical SAM protein [Streptomyces celluloflavus]|uniref:radical SAM protein n=1 Tax=Streptomyces celluloflavus TaxID=58344 RepID=UPI00368734F5